MYKVVRYFTDLQDNGYVYNVGDTFPHVGISVSKERLEELASDKNLQRTVLISQIEDKPKKYNEKELSGMTTKDIVSIASERGYKITKVKKSDVVEQFLEQQR